MHFSCPGVWFSLFVFLNQQFLPARVFPPMRPAINVQRFVTLCTVIFFSDLSWLVSWQECERMCSGLLGESRMTLGYRLPRSLSRARAGKFFCLGSDGDRRLGCIAAASVVIPPRVQKSFQHCSFFPLFTRYPHWSLHSRASRT